MSLQPDPIEQAAGVYLLCLPDADKLNPLIRQQFEAAKQAPSSHQTHHLHGRFENTYVDKDLLPALQPLFEYALGHARHLTGRSDLKFGFWFNEMGPGHRTSLHSHEEQDELLSAVYYVTIPPNSGRLLLHLDEGVQAIDPEDGMLLFFPPDLPHEVETNLSGETRLSLAMNFGPPGEE